MDELRSSVVQVNRSGGIGRGLGESTIETPQLITRLDDQVRSMRKLRARLGSVNRALRGSHPEDSPKPESKNAEVHFAAVTHRSPI